MAISGVLTFDLTISEDKTRDGAVIILRKIRPEWAESDIIFRTYTEGITNKLLGCRHKDDSRYSDAILIRIYGAKTDLIIDRDIEKLSMCIFNKAGCGKPLYAQFNNGLVYGFIQGECLDAESVRNPHISSLVAKEMARLANIDPSRYGDGLPENVFARFNSRETMLFPKIRKYLAEIPTSFPEPEREAKLKRDIKSKAELTEELNMLEGVISSLKSAIVLSHNDILLKNVVYNREEDRCYFIDYEYTAFNYQAYDIGNHFNEWAGVDVVDYNLYPDKATQIEWLKHYLREYKKQQGQKNSEPTDSELETLYVQVNKLALMSHFFWGVWALIQARYSTIDFDFLDYARIRLDEYYRRRDEFLALTLPE